MTRQEVLRALADGKEVEYDDGFGWGKPLNIPLGGPVTWFDCYWRLKPTPAKPIPMGPEDIPAVCWVRFKNNHDYSWFVLHVIKGGFYILKSDINCSIWNWRRVMDEMEYSTDRKEWKAMVKG
jgi:hypothetical protein